MKLIDVFALVGLMATVLVALLFGSMFIDYITDKIRKAKYHYKVKHRFDKPPTAKCYCIDCQRYQPIKGLRNGRCCKFNGWGVADNWFCWDATPKKKAGGQE